MVDSRCRTGIICPTDQAFAVELQEVLRNTINSIKIHAVIDTRIGGVRQDQDCGHTSGQQNAIIISITTTIMLENDILTILTTF